MAFALTATTMTARAQAQNVDQGPFSYGPVNPMRSAGPTNRNVDQGADAAEPRQDGYHRADWDDAGPLSPPSDTRAAQTTRTVTIPYGSRTTFVNVGAGGVTTVTVGAGTGSSWGMVAPRRLRNAPPQEMRRQAPEYVQQAANPRETAYGGPQDYATPTRYPHLKDPEIDFGGPMQEVRVPRDRATGHFVANVLINGVKTRVIIDTGATGTILSPDAARTTGAFKDITHAQYAAGIGGVTALNATKVRSLIVGGREIGGFDALIGREGIPYTLLGQSELRRLGRIVIDDDVLTITPRVQQTAAR
jgi:clan AA aspartic protease (TIGR02281 family)